jgi:virginiamycin B lyase
MRVARRTMGWCSLILVLGSVALITSFSSPQPASAAPVGTITNFSPTATQPLKITQGPDGALWFTNPADNSIGRITTDGVTSGFTDPTIDMPQGITAGPDDALWFTNEGNNSIGRISPNGAITNFTDPTIDEPVGIAKGSDGALWFTNEGSSSIGRISPAGAVTNFPLGRFGPTSFGQPTQIAAGADGNLWVMSNARGGGGTHHDRRDGHHIQRHT